MQQYRKDHRDRLNALGRTYYWQNIDEQREYKRDAVARKREVVREGLYGNLIETQRGLCAICGQPETIKRGEALKALAVDHDHITGKIRELLCQRCNTVLGIVDDNIEILDTMIEYLLKHSQIQ